ncbi:MAG: hypothetical protein V1821_00765 [bacterium]
MLFGGRFRLPQEVDEWNRERLHRRLFYNEKRALLRLKQRKMVEIHSRANSIFLALSERGRSLALQYKIVTCAETLPEHSFCYVVFDIPEEARIARRLLRGFLKRAGFTRIQLSVWQTNKAIAGLFLELVRVSGLGKWVTIICGRAMSDDDLVKKKKVEFS